VECACAGGGPTGNGSTLSASTDASSGSGSVAIDAATIGTEPMPASDAGVVVGAELPPDIDASCVCTPTGTSSCQVNPVVCMVDGDCPSGWTCDALVTNCACPAILLSDGATPPCYCPAPSGTCTPPYWNGGYAYASGGGSSASADASTAVLPTTGTGGGDAGGPALSTGGPTGNDAATATGPAAADAAIASGPASGGGTQPPSDDEDKNGAHGGCQIGARSVSRSATGLLTMLLLALGVTIGRRRLGTATRMG
jgi:hypothetical protein